MENRAGRVNFWTDASAYFCMIQFTKRRMQNGTIMRASLNDSTKARCAIIFMLRRARKARLIHSEVSRFLLAIVYTPLKKRRLYLRKGRAFMDGREISYFSEGIALVRFLLQRKGRRLFLSSYDHKRRALFRSRSTKATIFYG